MERCAFAVDEHVPRAWVTALESNGFSVRALPGDRLGDMEDDALLRWSAEDGRILITNDRDFLELDRAIDHAGLVLCANQSHSAGTVVRAIRRIDAQFTPGTIAGELVWLEDWL